MNLDRDEFPLFRSQGSEPASRPTYSAERLLLSLGAVVHFAGRLSTLTILGSTLLCAAAQPRYHAIDLSPLGFQAITAANHGVIFEPSVALNNHGHVAGTSADGHLLLWDRQQVHDLGAAGGLAVDPLAMNDSGQIVGRVRTGEFTGYGFLHSDGAFIDLGADRTAQAINAHGQVAGTFSNGVFVYHDGRVTEFTGFLPLPFQRISVTAINNSAEIAGTHGDGLEATTDRAFRLRGNELTMIGILDTGPSPEPAPSPRPSSFGTDLSDAGVLVGTTSTDAGPLGRRQTSFLQSMGRILDLSPDGGTYPQAKILINNLGTISTSFSSAPAKMPIVATPALWSGGVMLDLNSLVDLPSANLQQVFYPSAINDRGEILLNARKTTGEIVPVLLVPNPSAARLTALAARSIAGNDHQTPIAGFVVAGNSNGSILLRTVGPGLTPLGVTNAATDPAVKIFNSSGTVVATNDNWSADESASTTLASTATRLGAQPLAAGSNDAALLADLPPGAYTAHASNPADPSRIVLTEIYDAGDENAARLSAAAIRLQIGTGESIGIVGFALAGDGPAKVLLRALGPELASRGVTGALSDPQLFLYRGTTPVMGNDDWGSAASTPLLAFTTTQVGLPALPDASKDAALLIQLEPGAYSLHVSGANNATGVALVEVYLVPDTTQ